MVAEGNGEIGAPRRLQDLGAVWLIVPNRLLMTEEVEGGFDQRALRWWQQTTSVMHRHLPGL
jgi:hypothetical protein